MNKKSAGLKEAQKAVQKLDSKEERLRQIAIDLTLKAKALKEKEEISEIVRLKKEKMDPVEKLRLRNVKDLKPIYERMERIEFVMDEMGRVRLGPAAEAMKEDSIVAAERELNEKIGKGEYSDRMQADLARIMNSNQIVRSSKEYEKSLDLALKNMKKATEIGAFPKVLYEQYEKIVEDERARMKYLKENATR